MKAGVRRSSFPCAAPALAGLTLLALAGCDQKNSQSSRPASAQDFPIADRPVAEIISTRWSTEEARDRLKEAEQVMDRAGIRPGMTVADIGAGEGYYTVRLAARVGAKGRVLAQDILPEVTDALARRITREDWKNVSIKLGAVDDPKLPTNSFDRVFMVHMYHEIGEPYAFLWRLRPALKPGGQVIVVDADRPTRMHGTPSELLKCEFGTVGYRLVELKPNPSAGGYFARFVASGPLPQPSSISPCRLIS